MHRLLIKIMVQSSKLYHVLKFTKCVISGQNSNQMVLSEAEVTNGSQRGIVKACIGPRNVARGVGMWVTGQALPRSTNIPAGRMSKAQSVGY